MVRAGRSRDLARTHLDLVNGYLVLTHSLLNFMFSKKATKIDKIFIVDLTVTTYCQIKVEDFVNFCGLLRKRELYSKRHQSFELIAKY